MEVHSREVTYSLFGPILLRIFGALFFFNNLFNWRLATLQYSGGFGHTLA